jgi:hypothetical protein
MSLFIFSTACMKKYPSNSIKMSMDLFKKLGEISTEKRGLSNERKQEIYFKNKSDFLVLIKLLII